MRWPHPNSRQITACALGYGADRLAPHFAQCLRCRRHLAEIESLLTAMAAEPVPERDADYAAEVWQRLAPTLTQPSGATGGQALLPVRAAQRRFFLATLALAAAIALATLFLLPRHTTPAPTPATLASTQPSLLLQAVVATHLDRTQMLLVQLAHAQASPGARAVNLASEQSWARELLASNRLYQQGANAAGHGAMARLLADLEPILLQIAHSPAQLDPRQYRVLQARIEASGILFKVRVADQNLQAVLPSPMQNGAL